MLTRRGFSSFTACAICGITEFVATEAFAQGTQPAARPASRERYCRRWTVQQQVT
jgi:hypothetical protein